MKKRLPAAFICLALLFSLVSCGPKDTRSDDIVVLFTNDVHCGVAENIGYSGLASYKKSMSGQYRYVTLVDCGDFSQGGFDGSVTKGEGIVEIMNAVGYDYAIFGNHEFDYGMEQLRKNVAASNAQFLSCNLQYLGSGEDWLKQATKPYEIKTYGKVKVAFIGISTPRSIYSSTPMRFMEDGKIVYDFGGNEGAEHFYKTVQNTVDECRKFGVDFVVVLSHLGMDLSSDSPFTSPELAENTTGIDVILDAHSHTEAACWIRKNKDHKDVLLSSTGTKLANIGKLVLSSDGTASVGYIDNYMEKDADVDAKIAELNSQTDALMNKVLSHIDLDLSISDEDGVRMVRNREVPIGDFYADALRILGNADIGMTNGGGLRADLKAGDLTMRDFINVTPYANALCVVKVTGAELLDMLEYFYRNTEIDYKRNGEAVGEEGSFEQISGLKLTINTSVESHIEVDEADCLLGVTGERRVSDVQVLKNGEYVPIDPDETYTLAAMDYMIKNGGSGMLYFLADHELVTDCSIIDYQVWIDYIEYLNGDLSAYKAPAGRITIR